MSSDIDDQLATMLTDQRLERIDSALDSRLKGLTVLLEDLHKPQNMGACIRTLEAIGIQHIHIVDTDPPFAPNPKITQGCQKWIDIHRHTNVNDAAEALRTRGYRILATSPTATTTIYDLDFTVPTAFCFGNELDGMSQPLLELADQAFSIPMTGFTRSFNISVALGICLHTAAHARRLALGRSGDLTEQDKESLRSHWLRIGQKGSDQILSALSRAPIDP